MRIAFVADRSAPFYPGGAEDRMWNLSRRLAERHDVRVFTTLAPPEATIDGVRFVRIVSPLNHPYGTIRRSRFHELLFGLSVTRDWLQGWVPDIAIVEAIPYIHLPAIRCLSRRRGIRYVLTVNEAWTEYGFLGTRHRTPADWMISSLLRIGLRGAQQVVAISRTTADSLETSFGARGVRVIPCAVDLEEYKPYQAEYSLRNHLYDIVSVNRLEPIKRHEDLIHALAFMKDSFGWSGKAVIIGSGSLKRKLQRLVEELSISDQIDLPGFVSTAERRRIVFESKLLVLASEREGFSISTLEALATGVPAVVARPGHTEVFGVSEIVHDGINGLYYPVGNVKALAERLWSLLGNAPLRSRMSTLATLEASKFDWESVTKDLESLLTDLEQGHILGSAS